MDERKNIFCEIFEIGREQSRICTEKDEIVQKENR
jgi:hypothetical protein